MSSHTSTTINDTKFTKKWHTNYTRLMPYYYVNHRAKFVDLKDETLEKIVRVRKVVKNKQALTLEVAEKDNRRKQKQKITNLQNIIIPWNEIEEISLDTIKSKNYSFQFMK